MVQGLERRVQLFPGVIVPRNIALAVWYGTIEDRIDHDAAPWAGSPDGSESIDPEVAAIIEDVERFLEKQRVWGRRYNEFGPKNFHWRRDMAPDRYKEPSHRPISPLEVELGEAYKSEVPATNGHLGTNQILDYFSFDGGRERNAFLRSFNGDYFYGAEIIRGPAFHMAMFYGIHTNEGVVRLKLSPQDRKNIFIALAQSVHQFGLHLTDRVVEAFGLDKLADIVDNYSPFRVFKRELELVPISDLDRLREAFEHFRYEGIGGKEIMRILGYAVIRDTTGVPLLYYKPPNLQK